jgi:hypothetical protein
VQRGVDNYNREVRAHNARVRSNRQRLATEIARLNRQRSATRYVTVQTSTIALHTAYALVDEQSEQWNERGQELADLAEGETANSAQVVNTLLGESDTDAEDIEKTSLTDELSRCQRTCTHGGRAHGSRSTRAILTPRVLLHERPRGLRRVAQPGGARRRGVQCQAGLHARTGRGPDRALREDQLLARPQRRWLRGPGRPRGDERQRRDEPIFAVQQGHAWRRAGSFDIPTLRTIKDRVEDSIRFLSSLVRGVGCQPATSGRAPRRETGSRGGRYGRLTPPSRMRIPASGSRTTQGMPGNWHWADAPRLPPKPLTSGDYQ